MKAWPKEELQKIAGADDLHIAPFREDGSTYGTPTWIWSVALDDSLYVRGYNGQSRVGIRPRSSRRQAELSPPAWRKRLPSRLWKKQSTIA